MITKGSAKKKRKSKKRSRSKSQTGSSVRGSGGSADYPRHAVRNLGNHLKPGHTLSLQNRQAVLNAPKISDVYKYYRGENIPDEPFFGNVLSDKFGILAEKHDEFKSVVFESLDDAKLVEVHGEKRRVIDVSQGAGVQADTAGTVKHEPVSF